ncbi:hypothetical protein UFOVP978_18 [uncultured Caudovirales phage]|uniref:Uncharacterized protein n=1 Tax=uncultured Caudovirales phage TaxID=2100421 RepID=A0A6J5Q0J6_9CAUD|nr:hypothetical protein UFOVP978_18 [uncultured Caudovirales phage]
MNPDQFNEKLNEISKGERAGHQFRGNQYTKGRAGGAGGPKAPPRPKGQGDVEALDRKLRSSGYGRPVKGPTVTQGKLKAANASAAKLGEKTQAEDVGNNYPAGDRPKGIEQRWRQGVKARKAIRRAQDKNSPSSKVVRDKIRMTTAKRKSNMAMDAAMDAKKGSKAEQKFKQENPRLNAAVLAEQANYERRPRTIPVKATSTKKKVGSTASPKSTWSMSDQDRSTGTTMHDSSDGLGYIEGNPDDGYSIVHRKTKSSDWIAVKDGGKMKKYGSPKEAQSAYDRLVRRG